MQETPRLQWPVPEWTADWQLWQQHFTDLVDNQDSDVFGAIEGMKTAYSQIPNARVYDDGGTAKFEITSPVIAVSRRNNIPVSIKLDTPLTLLPNYFIGATITPGSVEAHDSEFELYGSVPADPSIQIFGYVTDAYTINWYNGATLALGDGFRPIFSFLAGSGTDTEKVKVTGADTTAGYLGDKLVEGTGIVLTVLNPGGNETIQIEADAAWVRTAGSPGYLSPATPTDTIRIGTGTAAQPGVSSWLDPDTGLVWLGSGVLAFSIDGTNEMQMKRDGSSVVVETVDPQSGNYVWEFRHNKTSAGAPAYVEWNVSGGVDTAGAGFFVNVGSETSDPAILNLYATGGIPLIDIKAESDYSGTSVVNMTAKSSQTTAVGIYSTGEAGTVSTASIELQAQNAEGIAQIILHASGSGDASLNPGYIGIGDGDTDYIYFVDINRASASPSWSRSYIPFSDDETEWDDYKANFGEVSILNAMNQALTGYWGRTGTVLNPSTDGDTVQVGAGTASAPGYSFEGLANLGLYAPGGAGTLGVSLSGTERWRFTDAGEGFANLEVQNTSNAAVRNIFTGTGQAQLGFFASANSATATNGYVWIEAYSSGSAGGNATTELRANSQGADADVNIKSDTFAETGDANVTITASAASGTATITAGDDNADIVTLHGGYVSNEAYDSMNAVWYEVARFRNYDYVQFLDFSNGPSYANRTANINLVTDQNAQMTMYSQTSGTGKWANITLDAVTNDDDSRVLLQARASGAGTGLVQIGTQNTHIVGFVDLNQAGSTWGYNNPLPISNATSDWDQWEVNFGEGTSIMAAMNSSHTSATYWARTTGTPNFVHPTVAADHARVGDTSTGDYIGLQHDGTNGRIYVGASGGAVTIEAADQVGGAVSEVARFYHFDSDTRIDFSNSGGTAYIYKDVSGTSNILVYANSSSSTSKISLITGAGANESYIELKPQSTTLAHVRIGSPSIDYVRLLTSGTSGNGVLVSKSESFVPGGAFHVVTDSATPEGTDALISRYASNVNNGPSLRFERSRGATIGTHSTVSNDYALGDIRFYGSDGDSFELGAAILVHPAETWNDAEHGATMYFRVTEINSTTTRNAVSISTNTIAIGNAGFSKIALRGEDGVAVCPETTVVPNAHFQVLTTDTPNTTVYIDNYGAGGGNELAFRRSDAGTIQSVGSGLASGYPIGKLGFYGSDGAALSEGAFIRASTAEAWSGSARGTFVDVWLRKKTTTTNVQMLYLSTDVIIVGDDDVTELKLLSSGNVSVTSDSSLTPSGKIHVQGVGTNGSAYVDCFSSTNAHAASLYLRKSANSVLGTNQAISNNEDMGKIIFSGGAGSGAWNDTVYIRANAAQAFGASAGGARLQVWTTQADSVTPVLAMQVTENQDLYVAESIVAGDTLGHTISGTMHDSLLVGDSANIAASQTVYASIVAGNLPDIDSSISSTLLVGDSLVVSAGGCIGCAVFGIGNDITGSSNASFMFGLYNELDADRAMVKGEYAKAEWDRSTCFSTVRLDGSTTGASQCFTDMMAARRTTSTTPVYLTPTASGSLGPMKLEQGYMYTFMALITASFVSGSYRGYSNYLYKITAWYSSIGHIEHYSALIDSDSYGPEPIGTIVIEDDDTNETLQFEANPGANCSATAPIDWILNIFGGTKIKTNFYSAST